MRTQAIILKKIPIREYDELIVCYTPDSGKQTYQAKGVLQPHSKQASHLDVFNLVDFSLNSGNGHPIIASAYSFNAYPNLKSSLPALAAGYFLLECFDKLVFDGEADMELWNLLYNQLGNYDVLAKKGGTNWLPVIVKTRQELMATLGHDPASLIEELAGTRFRSLQFAKKVIG